MFGFLLVSDLQFPGDRECFELDCDRLVAIQERDANLQYDLSPRSVIAKTAVAIINESLSVCKSCCLTNVTMVKPARPPLPVPPNYVKAAPAVANRGRVLGGAAIGSGLAWGLSPKKATITYVLVSTDKSELMFAVKRFYTEIAVIGCS